MIQPGTTIYTLADPSTHEVRYIGKTAQSVHTRLRGHVGDLGRSTHKVRWIQSLLPCVPILTPLCTVEHSQGSETEIRAIAMYRSRGARLVNATDGGEGCAGWERGPQTLARMSAAQLGHKCSPETRAKISATLRGQKLSPRHCAKISKSNLGRICSPETRSKISASQRLAHARRRTEATSPAPRLL